MNRSFGWGIFRVILAQAVGIVIEDGLAELDDILKERIASLKAERERATAALERARSASRPDFYISSALIERFTETMREKLCFGEIPMRKAYLGSIVDRVEVDDGVVRIMGRKDTIEQGIRRLLTHVLPKGFRRIRHYGLLASGARADNLTTIRILLAMDAPAPSKKKADAPAPDKPVRICPCCGSSMIVIETFEGSCRRRRPAPAPAGIDTS